jgi:hypothetical protein
MQPMMVLNANAAYCYDRVNYVIMSLVWIVLTNGNIPAIIAAIICLQTMKFFQQPGFGESKTFFWRRKLPTLYDGTRTREQSSITIMDTAQLNHGKCFQTIEMRGNAYFVALPSKMIARIIIHVQIQNRGHRSHQAKGSASQTHRVRNRGCIRCSQPVT